MRRPTCLVAYGLVVALAVGCSPDASEQTPSDGGDQAVWPDEPARPGEPDGLADDEGGVEDLSSGDESGDPLPDESPGLRVDAVRLEEGDDIPSLDWSTLDGDLQLVYDPSDRPMIEATYDGTGGNGYARVQFEVDWNEGDEVEYGVEVYLPGGFMDAMSGAVDLIRWDNWATDANTTDHGGVALGSDGKLRLLTERLGVSDYEVLLGPVELEEERWTSIEVRQRLSSVPGQARHELYVDGRRVDANREANHYGRRISSLRAGIVSIDSDADQDWLQLYFDDVSATPG